MGFNTRWDVSKTKRQLYNRAAWNTIDAMMSARAQSKQQLYNQASRVILKLVVDPRNVTQNLEVKSKKVKKSTLQVKVIPQKCTSLQVDFKINYLSNVTK